jgi:hypothetical protein
MRSRSAALGTPRPGYSEMSRQVSWLAGHSASEPSQPPEEGQWCFRKSSPLTVAGAATVLRPDGYVAPCSLLIPVGWRPRRNLERAHRAWTRGQCQLQGGRARCGAERLPPTLSFPRKGGGDQNTGAGARVSLPSRAGLSHMGHSHWPLRAPPPCNGGGGPPKAVEGAAGCAGLWGRPLHQLRWSPSPAARGRTTESPVAVHMR